MDQGHIDDDEICLGRLFFNQPTPGCPRHPHIIASDPVRDPERVVVVNLSTEPCLGDVSYVIDPGKHPAISERSYVRCDFAAISTAEHLRNRVRKDVISLSRCVSDKVLGMVHRALNESRRPSGDVKDVLRDQGFIG